MTVSQSFAHELIHCGALLELTVDKVGQQAGEVVREGDLLITVSIHSSHDRIDVVFADESRLCWTRTACLIASMRRQYAFELLTSQLATVAHV